MAATKSAHLKVHQLAKELNVNSKDIIEKCKAEGIDAITTHLSPVSVGLAESIREWFSGHADITSVEQAARPAVKRKPPVKKPSTEGDSAAAHASSDAAAHGEADSADAAAIAPDETTSATPAEETHRIAAEHAAEAPLSPASPAAEDAVAASVAMPSKAAHEAVAVAQAPIGPVESGLPASAALGEKLPAPAVVVGVPPATDQSAEVRPLEKEKRPAAVRADIPPPPPAEPVRPAGPQLVPKPAELKGPRVVRIEAPDVLPKPRPRMPSEGGMGPRPGGPPRPGMPPRVGGPARPLGDATTTPARKGRGTGRREEEEAARNARSPRRHGNAEVVDQRLREWREQDILERKERLASATGQGLRNRSVAEKRRQTTHGPAGPVERKSEIEVVAPISVKDFCSAIGVGFGVLSKKLIEHTGKLWQINQVLDAETAELIAMEAGVQVKIVKAKTAYERLRDEFDQRERKNLQPRPPVVAMLGHVDHGKTSLLDAIRTTNVAAGEAGGITQHIGAYRIDRNNWHVTFLDTPGHQAFTAMRARGANLTDVVVLVVAADDGVMPQTAEAINHAKAAGVTIVVALNKIDMPGVDVNKVFGQLTEHGLTPAEWGGTIDVIRTSATKKTGIDELVAHLSTLSDLLDLKADPSVPAMGMVIEAHMREGEGVVAMMLVREGTLKVGQFVVCGPASGRIRTLKDDRGQRLTSAKPGTPVEVIGLDVLPSAGDRLYQVDDLTTAKDIASEVQDERRQEKLHTAAKPTTLEALLKAGSDADIPELNVIVKADVQGSIDVLKKTLGDFPASKARLRVLHSAVGAITEADVALAQASKAIIIGFHVVPEERARQMADASGVEIRSYRVIYEMIDDLEKALAGLLEPDRKEENRGAVLVKQVYNITRLGTVAGCEVKDGIVARSHYIRIVRDGRVVHTKLEIGSLKRFKDDAREVRAGLECGIKLVGYDDLKPGDILQAYEVIEIAQKLT